MPPITIKEIAKLSNVSFQAVSAVLNNRTGSRVSAATRKRILSIAKEKGYRPNFGYQLMRGKTPPTIAILVSINYIRITEYTRDLLLMLMGRFNQDGYATYAHTFGKDPAENCDKIRELINRGVSHFVFIGAPFGHMEIINEINANKLHYISTSSEFPRYITENQLGRVQLLKNFRERFGLNFRIMCQSWECELDGSYFMHNLSEVFPDYSYEQLLDKLIHKIPAIDYPSSQAEMKLFEVGYAETKVMLDRYPSIRGLFFMNDYFALGAVKALQELGLVVGQDISLAGYDNVLATQTSTAPISTAEFCLPRLLELISQKVFTDEPCRIVLPARVLIKS